MGDKSIVSRAVSALAVAWSTDWRRVAVPALVAYTVVAPTIAVGFSVQAALVLILAGAAGLLMTRLPEIVELSAWGFRAKMKEKLAEASATVEQLRRLAAAIGASGTWAVSYGSRISNQPVDLGAQIIREIRAAMIGAGLDSGAVDRATYLWRKLVLRDLGYWAARYAATIDPGASKEAQRFNLGSQDDDQAAQPEELEEFLSTHGALDEEGKRRLANYFGYYNGRDPTDLGLPHPESFPDDWKWSSRVTSPAGLHR